MELTPYQQLPDCVKQYYSEREYLFMTDAQKANIIDENTEPEVEE